MLVLVTQVKKTNNLVITKKPYAFYNNKHCFYINLYFTTRL